jgi:hypothetical protein
MKELGVLRLLSATIAIYHVASNILPPHQGSPSFGFQGGIRAPIHPHPNQFHQPPHPALGFWQEGWPWSL